MVTRRSRGILVSCSNREQGLQFRPLLAFFTTYSWRTTGSRLPYLSSKQSARVVSICSDILQLVLSCQGVSLENPPCSCLLRLVNLLRSQTETAPTYYPPSEGSGKGRNWLRTQPSGHGEIWRSLGRPVRGDGSRRGRSVRDRASHLEHRPERRSSPPRGDEQGPVDSSAKGQLEDGGPPHTAFREESLPPPLTSHMDATPSYTAPEIRGASYPAPESPHSTRTVTLD